MNCWREAVSYLSKSKTGEWIPFEELLYRGSLLFIQTEDWLTNPLKMKWWNKYAIEAFWSDEIVGAFGN